MYFQYDENATEYLKQKDKRLGEVIDKIGKIEREADSDLFSSVVHHIIGQLWNKSDDEVINELSELKGIGIWTAEMILLFCMQRPNVFSYGDLAILRGMRMVYHHRKIDRKLFEKYRRRLSPYCSVASLYFWAVAGGAIPEMKDYAPKRSDRKNG